MRLMPVEADPMIASAVRTALRDAAYAVDVVGDARTALTALKNREHQLVLLDVGLPGRDGFEVLRELRTHGNSVPVIIITGRDNMDERVRELIAPALPAARTRGIDLGLEESAQHTLQGAPDALRLMLGNAPLNTPRAAAG